MSSCAQDAISIKCGSLTLKGPETGKNADPEPVRAKHRRNGRIVWGALLAVLVFALIYFNFIDVPESAETQQKTEQTEMVPVQEADTETTAAVPERQEAETDRIEDTSDDTVSSAPVGNEVGQQLEDFTCNLTDGSTFHLADHRGEVVIINQWATYCTPCVNELPYFEQLKEDHPEVEILAIHHWLESNPQMLPFMIEKGWNEWEVDFTIDTEEMGLLDIIGGDNTMPRTLVLNKKGEVVYNEQRSVTLEMLEELLKKAED